MLRFLMYTDRQYLPDTGTGSGSTAQPTETPTTGGEPGKQPSGGTGEQPTAQTSGGSRTFTQDQVNAMLADERRKAKEKSEREQEEQRAVEQGEFQKLADQRQKSLEKLEPEVARLTEANTRLSTLIETILADRVRQLPAELAELRPSGNVEEQVSWLVKAEKAASKLVKERGPVMPGGPRGTGAAATQQTLDDLVEAKRRSGQYNGGF